MTHHELNYLERLREMGFRVTPQRQLVLDAICDMGSHATARQIYERVRTKVPTVNRSTIYRTLDFFCDLRMVVKTDIDGQIIYEIVGEKRHHHLVCRSCGHVAVLADYHFDHLNEHLYEEHGFKAEFDHIVISGLCQGCQTKH